MLYWKYAFLFHSSGLHWTFTTCFPHITGLLKTFQCCSIIYRIKFKPLILISEAWLWWFYSPSSPSHNQHTHTHTHMLQTWVSESWVSTCKYHSFFWTYPYALVLPRVPLPSLCNKYFTTTSPKTQTHKQSWSIYRFPWRKHSHYGQFQLTNVVSLNAKLGRDGQWPTMMKYLYHHFINKIKQS